MPAAEDGDWNSHCSNVVCVRTKFKDSENSEGVPIISIRPRPFHRNEPFSVSSRSSPQSPRPAQRRRITRLVQTPTLTPTLTPIHYEGVSKVSINLKTPDTESVYNDGPDFTPHPFTPSQRSIALRRSFEPKFSRYDLPDSTSHSTSGRNFRPVSWTSVRRSTSIPPSPHPPPSPVSTPYARRSSVISVPSYTRYSFVSTGNQIGKIGNVRSSLRRGSVDVSTYFRIRPTSGFDLLRDSSKGISGIRSSVPGSPIRSRYYRLGSLSVLGSDRPTYRSSTSGRLVEDEFKSSPLSATSDLFASLRSRTQQALVQLDANRYLPDRYPSGRGSRAPAIASRFVYQTDRNSQLEWLPRATSTGRPSMDRSDHKTSVARAASGLPPSAPVMSEARRRIRNVLYKVSGDQEYLK